MTASVVHELNQPVSGGTVVFTLGTQTKSAATNGSGVATIKLNQKQGTYTVSAAFAEDAIPRGCGQQYVRDRPK